jgi:hypothetical protein
MATEESSPALPSKPAPAGGVRARWAGIPRKGKLRAALVLVGAAALGLPTQPPEGASLTDVPPNLDQTFSSVREALGNLMEAAAKLGVVSSSWDLTPKQVVEEFYSHNHQHDKGDYHE